MKIMGVFSISQITKQVVKYLLITTYVRLLSSNEMLNSKAINMKGITNKNASFKLRLLQ